MVPHAINDWDDAYANAPNIPQGDSWPGRWETVAAEFRKTGVAGGRMETDIRYGSGPRNVYDLFHPAGKSRGLVVFVHGGFWLRLSASIFSHLAAGPVANGWTVAMPTYTLCPQAQVSGIVEEIAAAITEAAGQIDGPIRLAGHSAGGQLVTRMICEDTPLDRKLARRIECTMSISGLHDLRPLLKVAMNKTIGLDEKEAAAQSPALCRPIAGSKVICWAGAGERSEFIRQNALLANIWKGVDADTVEYLEPDRHHFNIVDSLADANSPMTRALLE
ncbi:MAG: alpha/beta hydrolase [Rhizobiaceae bacterium]